MSTTYLPAPLRRAIKVRADERCEYCQLHGDDAAFSHEVDHIIAERHDGATVESNLALACFQCNRNKGTDFGSILPDTGEIVRFYNPRTDFWSDHFRFKDDDLAVIETQTQIGAITARMLGFNAPERVEQRRILVQLGTYPPPAKNLLA